MTDGDGIDVGPVRGRPDPRAGRGSGRGSGRGRGRGPSSTSVYFPLVMAWAWIAVIATVLTMSGTVQPRLKSLTGFFRPCSTGPTAIAPDERCTAL